MLVNFRNFARALPTRRSVAAVAGAVFLAVAFCAPAAAAGDDEIQNGRLGYRWTPEPPKQPMSPDNQLAWNVAKYGGGGLLALWVLRKLASSD